MLKISILDMCLKIIDIISQTHLPRANELNLAISLNKHSIYGQQHVLSPEWLYPATWWINKKKKLINKFCGEYFGIRLISVSAGLAPDILKMESWTHMGCTLNIIIKDIINIFASICKNMRILLMGRRYRERWSVDVVMSHSHKNWV